VNVLILGANGFIGHHLAGRILETTDWHVYAMDRESSRLGSVAGHERFHFYEGDITINREWVEYHVSKCDVVLPLVAIATPAVYVTDPLAVFELDFEANLPIVRACVKFRKRLIFASTSEVYGMSADAEFHPYETNFVLGPVAKSRWIYSCAKQLMDRVIAAYGQQHDLRYTLFRPFNFIGSGLDNIYAAKEGSSRVVTQFLGHIARGEKIQLVDGGAQQRSFTDIYDGVSALMRIIENPNDVANGKIYNIGNPANNVSIRELARRMLAIAREFAEYRAPSDRVEIVDTTSGSYYGAGYQDIQSRVPYIGNTCEELGWAPTIGLDDALRSIFQSYRGEPALAASLIDNA